MNTDRAYMIINYDLLKEDYTIDTNMKFDGMCEALNKYMTGTFNTKNDNSQIDAKPVYKVVLNWFRDEDVISVYSDVGNKNLENYLLFDIWRDFLG